MYEYSKIHLAIATRFYNTFNQKINKGKLFNSIINDPVFKGTSQSTRTQYILKSIRILKTFGLKYEDGTFYVSDKKPKRERVNGDILIMNIYKEGIARKRHNSYNYAEIQTDFASVRLFLVSTIELDEFLVQWMRNDYISFGHLTGGTINWHAKKITEFINENKSKYAKISFDKLI